jgi:hypothetical protein
MELLFVFFCRHFILPCHLFPYRQIFNPEEIGNRFIRNDLPDQTVTHPNAINLSWGGNLWEYET